MPTGNNYTAIAIDTSILKGNGFDFSGQELKGFEQFKNSPITLLVSDIVHRECLSQLAETIKSSSDKVASAIQTLKKHSVIDKDTIDQVSDSLRDKVSNTDIAERNLQKFYTDSGAQILPIGTYQDVSGLFDLYFSGAAPFGKTKKKNEFPDAAILLSIESWAEDNDRYVVLVGKDGDWKEFAEGRGRFIVFDEVDRALEFLQPVEDVDQIKGFLNQEEPFSSREFMQEMLDESQDFVESLSIDTLVSCELFHETEDGVSTLSDT